MSSFWRISRTTEISNMWKIKWYHLRGIIVYDLGCIWNFYDFYILNNLETRQCNNFPVINSPLSKRILPMVLTPVQSHQTPNLKHSYRIENVRFVYNHMQLRMVRWLVPAYAQVLWNMCIWHAFRPGSIKNIKMKSRNKFLKTRKNWCVRSAIRSILYSTIFNWTVRLNRQFTIR